MLFAREKHRNQTRKYTGEPYENHLAEVAGIVATVEPSPDAIATAWLHDVVEDCGVSLAELEQRFGAIVADGVMMLSDMEQGNRQARKAASRARLSGAHGWVQTIKCADLISNTKSIVKHDHNFAKVYLNEAASMLSILKDADDRLWLMAKDQLIAANLLLKREFA